MQESGYRNILFLNTSRESFFSQEFIPSTILNPEEKSLLMSLATSSKRTFLSSFLSTSDIKGKFYFWITAHEFLFSLIKRNFYRKVYNKCKRFKIFNLANKILHLFNSNSTSIYFLLSHNYGSSFSEHRLQRVKEKIFFVNDTYCN